jgi:hypothetical protein
MKNNKNRVSELELTQNKSTDTSSSWVLMKIEDIYEEVIDGKYNNRQVTVKLRSYRPGKNGHHSIMSKSYIGECEYMSLKETLVPWTIEDGDERDIRGYLDGSLIGYNVVATIKQGPNGPEVVELSRVVWPTGYSSDVDYANDFTDQEIHDLQNPRICWQNAA